MWGEEFGSFLFCFSQKIHDPEEDLVLLPSSSSSFLHCYLAGNYFVSHDITWERCFTVICERAISRVQQGGYVFTNQTLYLDVIPQKRVNR